MIFTATSKMRGTNTVRLRDAQAAVYAADGYSRSSGRPSVVLTYGIAEAMEAASALLTAWGDKVPLVVVNQIDPESHRQAREVYAAVTRSSYTLREERDMENALQKISEKIFSHVPIQCLISERIDPQSLIEKLSRIERSTSGRRGDERESWNRDVWTILKSFKRPIILLGRGGTDIDPSLLSSLAREWSSPILLTASATTMPYRTLEKWKEESLVLIPSGNFAWAKLFFATDGILTLGSALSEVDGFGLKDWRFPRAKVVAVGIEEGGVAGLCHRYVQADAGRFASAFLKELRTSRVQNEGKGWMERAKRASETWKEVIVGEAMQGASHDAIDPAFAAYQIVHKAPEETIFVSEGSSCGMWVWSYLWLQPFVFPVQHGTIGVTIPMSLGAHLSSPDRPVWAVFGDGAFFYNIQELATLKGRRVPIVGFVLNDASWSAIRLAQTFLYRNRYIGTDLPPTDYAKIAELYGCEGITVRKRDEMIDAIRYAKTVSLRKKGPLIVDIQIENKDHTPFAGVNFVISEIDGTVKSLALQSIVSAGIQLVKRRFPRRLTRAVVRMVKQK